MKLFKFIMLICLLSVVRTARADVCRYEPRIQDPLLSELPKEFVGSADCGSSQAPLNIFVVARLARANNNEAAASKSRVLELATRYARIVSAGRLQVRELKSEGLPRFEIGAVRPHGSSVHFVSMIKSKAGESLVLIYTDTKERAFRLSGTIRDVQSKIGQDAGLLDF